MSFSSSEAAFRFRFGRRWWQVHKHHQKQRPPFLLAITLAILLFLVRCIDASNAAFTASSLPLKGITALYQDSTHDNETNSQRNKGSSPSCSTHTSKLTTASGKYVSRYALGGAARSVQLESLPLNYRDLLSRHVEQAAPFYFYYNPHRYPAFLSGVAQCFTNDERSSNYRKDVFIASGGTERSPSSLDIRLSDALVHSGGKYLDAFVLEYICPYELVSDDQLSMELEQAIEHAHEMKREGKIRYVMASTHSHSVGLALASATLPSHPDTTALDAIMLRYSMSHRIAAESLSLPKALENNIPVLAFTTTRWNRLQSDPPAMTDSRPTTSDCLKFALNHPAVEIVLHSARDNDELDEAILPLFSSASSGQSTWLSEDEYERWLTYGSDEMKWNENDAFDEYPEESMID